MTRSDSYPRSLVLLHWLVFVAAALAVAAIELKGFFPKGSADRAQMTLWHESFGLAVLLLMTIRLVVRASVHAAAAPRSSLDGDFCSRYALVAVPVDAGYAGAGRIGPGLVW
jgi:cytochrome b561